MFSKSDIFDENLSMYLWKEELCEEEDEEGGRSLDQSLDKNTLGSYWGKHVS